MAGNEYVNRLKEIREELRTTLKDAQERMRKHYDGKREPQPNFQVGDKVMLNAKNIQTLRPSKEAGSLDA